MHIFNVHEAKTHLSKLLKLVEEGEEVIIAKAGKPVVEMKKASKKPADRQFGMFKGKIEVPDNFNDEDPEINKMFFGE